MRDELAILAINSGVDQDVRPGLIVVAVVVRRVLVPPGDPAIRCVERDGAVGEEIVAWPE